MIGLASSSFATNIATLFFTYGIVAGGPYPSNQFVFRLKSFMFLLIFCVNLAFGLCLNYTGFIIAMSTYFHKKHAIAFSITQAGVGLGLFIFGPLLQILINEYGWRGSFLICGAIGLQFTVLGSLIFPLRKAANETFESEKLVAPSDTEENAPAAESLPMSVLVKDVRGWLLHLTTFFWLMATLILYVLLGDYVKSQELDDYYLYMLSAMGIGDLIGRLLTGPIAEYFHLNVIVMLGSSQLVCALSIVSLLFVFNGYQMIAQGVLFSITYGCQCVLLALVPRFIFGGENLTNIFGINMFFGGAGILIGPPIAGLLVDLNGGSYAAALQFSFLAELCSAVVTFICWYMWSRRKSSQPQLAV